MNKYYVLIIYIVFQLLYFNTFGAPHSENVELDYTIYHKNIIEAEKKIFINNDSIGGLNIIVYPFLRTEFLQS